MTDHLTIPPPPPPPPLRSVDRAPSWVTETMAPGGEGGTPGSDREGVDRGFTLAAQAASPALQAASAPTGSPSVSSVPAGDVQAQSPDPKREARAAAKAAKAVERRQRRADRTEFLRHPVPVDRSWAKWIAGGLLLIAVCGFMWKVAERHAPTLVVNTSPPTAATTATSGPGVAATNPFQGVGHPVSNLAAAIISSYDPAGRTVVVSTSSGDLSLGAGRVEDLAGQMWGMGQTDPCDVYITSPDPRQSPKAIKKVDGQPLPPNATPLFDCKAPTTTAPGPAGAAAKAGE